MTDDPNKIIENAVEKLHMSELSGNHHEFLSDWYRPARCTECGQTRYHNIHKTNTDE